MIKSGLHPSFDPDLHTDAEPYTPDQVADGQVQDLEYAIAVEVAQLQSEAASRQQLERFCTLLQQTRDEQIRLRQQFERLMEILAA